MNKLNDVAVRGVWFLLGGLAAIAINTGLFGFFEARLGNRYLAYGMSLGLTNVLLFLWNYFIGFKTAQHWTVAARRQAACLAVANLLNYSLVVSLQGVFPEWPKLVIAGVQAFVGVFKFGLYHVWVYPLRDLRPVADEAVRC